MQSLPFSRRLVVLILIFVLAFSSLSLADDITVQYQIHGKVIDQNGATVVNALVTAVKEGKAQGISASTDTSGEFQLTLEPGDYKLVVKAKGFSETSQQVAINGSDTKPLEVMLQIAASTATVMVSDSAEYQSEIVSSATKTFTPILNIPQSISVVSKQQIADQLMTSVGDVVRFIPGVTAHQGENNRDQIIIRGQSSSADFFVNGVRDDVQYYRDLYNLDSLELLRGPNAMIFGRGGGGGVLNRVTKVAGFTPIREISLQGGSYGNKRGSVDFDQPFGSRFALRTNGFYENSDSFRKNVNLERYGVNPTVTFNPDTNTSLSLGYEFFHDGRTADRGITSFQGKPVDVPVSTYYGNPDDSHVRANVNVLTGTFDRRIGNLLVHNRTMYGDYDRFYQNYVPGAVNVDKSLVTLTAYNNETRRKNLFSQTDLSYEVSTGSIKHVLLGGFELGRQLTNNFRNTGFFNNSTTFILVPFGDPTISTSATFRQSSTDANNRVGINLAAAYVQDQIELSRFVQIVGGARFDYFDLKYHNNRDGQNIGRIDRLVSPRIGVVVKPIQTISLYGSHSVSFLPSAGDQFSSLAANTQTLKPEKFTNYEIGVKWDILHNLSFTSAAYRLDRTNTRANDPLRPGILVPTGSQRTNGFEAGLNGNLTRAWTLAGGYSYQDAFITSATTAAVAGKQVGQVPHHNFSIWNKYQFIPKLGAGLGIISRSDMFAAVDNSVTLPGYTRADAAVYYSFNEKWRMQANVENLFNSQYILNADSNTNISPGSPRALKIGLIARF